MANEMDSVRRRQWEWLAAQCDGVVPRAEANALVGRAAVRWALGRGRCQEPTPGLLVLHNGPLTEGQWDRVALRAAGPGTALAGITAATRQGLRGFIVAIRHLVAPRGSHAQDCEGVRVHYSRLLGETQVLWHRDPPQTGFERSVVDAARWAGRDDDARAVLGAAVQQRLTTASRLREQLHQLGPCRRRRLIATTLDDVEGGSHTVAEMEFLWLVRRAGLPEPDRQVLRQRTNGHWYLDVRWSNYAVVVEIDGAAHWDVVAREADQARDNELTISGDRVLRFSNHAVRTQGAQVVEVLTRMLHTAGWRRAA